jgi:hypothetical protein
LAEARHLPRGRHRAGDRHLNFYDTRDKLASSASAGPSRYVRSGGDAADIPASTATPGSLAPIPSGTYRSLTVTGFCIVLDGSKVIVQGALTIAPNAALDGLSCSAPIIVGEGVRVGAGAILALGGSVIGRGCTTPSTTVIHDGLRAVGAADVILHGNKISGGVSISGGGGGFNCDNGPIGPRYNVIEDGQISGGVSESGVATCWIGFNRVQVDGTVTFANNQIFEFYAGWGDTMEILSNVIHGSLSCWGNDYPPTDINSGTGWAEPSLVTGRANGQCLTFATNPHHDD